ncbi:hypothetical protein [Pseudoalteromonas luteoviolacea]|uniref:Uncharacterized protein n=1 Tax=Pseudoalteromonas luteoviolacea (strain 2ta16) TaxID=1353533 RepID=V4HU16_PSEL2|nr:hypothetical protein [Pseudoalteromonas luteoviolacea]ESP91404.1 hypothetical protein PL2TA16_00203 [Pseudoalteromonas luteoviolacea 2ta16]KZN40050.1 hypothetical protein N483_17845 [Pseudoalteromonas luteoviolacea NCIMB 1944]
MKYVFSILLLLSLIGCDMSDEVSSLDTVDDVEKVWVFAQFNVPQENDEIESYYYYGEISKRLYTSISGNKIESGFILMSQVKYWGNDDLIHDYKNVESSGEIVFRIEDIATLNLLNMAPTVGKGYEQFDNEEQTNQTSEPAQKEISNP